LEFKRILDNYLRVISKTCPESYGELAFQFHSLHPTSTCYQVSSSSQIVGCPEGIVDFTETMIRDGIYLITDAPQGDVLEAFLKDIGAIHSATHFGPGLWRLFYEPQTKELPNSCRRLELHIDMPYLTKPAQVSVNTAQRKGLVCHYHKDLKSP